MRPRITLAKLIFAGAIPLLVASCGAKTHPEQRGDWQEPDGQPTEDSGKRISGEFVLISLENTYAAKKDQAPPATVFTFDENGNFKRQDKSRIEEGSYLISTQDELVVYIEKVNGDLLAAARVDRYSMTDQSGDSITLQSGPSRKLVLRKLVSDSPRGRAWSIPPTSKTLRQIKESHPREWVVFSSTCFSRFLLFTFRHSRVAL